MMIDFFLERICRRKKKKDEGAFLVGERSSLLSN